MEISTRNRKKQVPETFTSERASRSLSRQKEREEELESGLRRSIRGKVETAEPCRRGRSSQRASEGAVSRKTTKNFSESGEKGLRRKILKKSLKKCESPKDKSNSHKDERESRTELEVGSNELLESQKDEDESQTENKVVVVESDSEYFTEPQECDLVCRNGGDLKRSYSKESDEEFIGHSGRKSDTDEATQSSEMEAQLSHSENNISDNIEDNVFKEDDKLLVGKRRKKKRRFNPKKKEPLKNTKDVRRRKIENETGEIKSAENHQLEGCKDEDYEPTQKKSRLSFSMISKLKSSQGFVDKVDLGSKPEEAIPMRRTPRMASLNAIAKVNAVLESYSPLAGKTMSEIKESASTRKFDSKVKVDKRRKRSTSSVTQTDDIAFFPPLNSTDDWMTSAASNDVFNAVTTRLPEEQPISDSKVSSTSNWGSDDDNVVAAVTKDKAVQTVANHKAVQTDAYLMHDNAAEALLSNSSNCTCNSPGSSPSIEGTKFYKIPPTATGNTLNVPLRSSILTRTTTHTIAIPFTKTHVLSHMNMCQLDSLPSHVNNAQTNKRMASLNAIAMMNAMKVLEKPFLGLTEYNGSSEDIERSDRLNTGHIRIPKINFQATSTSKFSGGNRVTKVSNPVKPVQLKNLSSHIERLIETKKTDVRLSSKMVNGWLFEGEPLEKPVVYDDRVVIRRYYSSMRRNAEIINVRDAVLLKSGPRKKDLPFVARVASIWEEEEGFSAGDMMISVFWYYRPEQTEVGKIPGYSGDLEVLASRHRDDNSAACVVDKCYVLSYPQYCRFRARNKLIRESRKIPLSPVPPTESTRPGVMPPSNIDPNLVFFCRHAYDSRTGKIIKNPFY